MKDIKHIITQMTLEEKVGQMTQVTLDLLLEGEPYKVVKPHKIVPENSQSCTSRWDVSLGL